jgi:3-hydroxy-9,10-secoandrosta-1,3,5(10)-triene-9,17-dione monooxygenase reductase component
MPKAPLPPVESAPFRRLMARWATGVSVVTTHDAGRDEGLTVNSFLSVSLTPPRVLISIMNDADAWMTIRRSQAFAVSVLAANQRAISERFAKRIPSAEKFAGIELHRGLTDAALLDGSIATFECQVAKEIDAGDHMLFLGLVVAAEEGVDAPPLLFYRSAYAEAEPDDLLRLPRSSGPQ